MLERVEKLPQHVRVGRHRHVLVRRDLGVAVREQVDRDAAPDVGQLRQLMAPQMPVQQHAVDEQRDRTRALLDVG